MADTVDIPKLGNVKTTWLWVGGGITGGIVFYAYWRRHAAASAAAVAPAAVDTTSPGPLPTPSTAGNSSYSSPPAGGFVSPGTNAQWTQEAEQYLLGLGFDSQFVATALGKYLTNQVVSSNESDVIRAAIAAFGNPPIGGPFTIHLHSDSPPPTVPADPSNVRLIETSPHSMSVAWDAVSGADDYVVHEHSRIGWRDFSTTQTSYIETGLVADLDHTWTIHARNRAGMSPGVDVTGHTRPEANPTPPPAPAPPPPPPAPAPPPPPAGHVVTVDPYLGGHPGAWAGTLSGIAWHELGDANRWPEIWHAPQNAGVFNARGGNERMIRPGDPIWVPAR